MQLSELATVTPHYSLRGDGEVRTLTLDSRTAEEGSLFFCARGVHCDRHDFAAHAYSRGCRAFCAEKPLSLPSDAAVLLVPSARLALADIAARLYQHPEKELTLIAVTGTKGKTTTGWLLRALLAESGVRTGFIGTLGAFFADKRIPIANTTPESAEIYRLLSEMRAAGVTHVVVEVSSQALAVGRVRGLRFPIAVLTGLGYDHVGIGEHESLSGYFAAKKELFTCHRTETIFYPEGDVVAKALLSTVSAKKIPVGGDTRTRLYCREGEVVRNERGLFQEYTISRDGATYPVKSSLAGAFNVRNSLLAVAAYDTVMRRAGWPVIPLSKVAHVLENTSIPGRFHCIPTSDNRLFVINYAHNAKSMAETLAALRCRTAGRLIVLFGSVGRRLTDRRTSLGRVVSHYADLAIITADNCGDENPTAIAEEIRSVMGTTPVTILPDRKSAIRFAVKESREGDVIALCGKGNEEIQITAEGEESFCEENVLLGCLEESNRKKKKYRRWAGRLRKSGRF